MKRKPSNNVGAKTRENKMGGWDYVLFSKNSGRVVRVVYSGGSDDTELEVWEIGARLLQ